MLTIRCIVSGYIHDVVSPSMPQESARHDQELENDSKDTEKTQEAEDKAIAEEIIQKFQKDNFVRRVTVGYTYDAFFVSDGRSRGKHFEEKGGKQRYTCNECGKDYATSSNLSRHKQTHRSLDSKLAKKCPHCSKAYVSMPALSMHMLTHELKHKCVVCVKVFSRPWLPYG